MKGPIEKQRPPLFFRCLLPPSPPHVEQYTDGVAAADRVLVLTQVLGEDLGTALHGKECGLWIHRSMGTSADNVWAVAGTRPRPRVDIRGVGIQQTCLNICSSH